MEQAGSGLVQTFTKAKNRTIFFTSFFLLMLGYFALANGTNALQVLSFSSIPIVTRLQVFLAGFFDVTEFLTPSVLFLVVGVSIFGALTATLLLALLRIRKETVMESGVYSGFALILAILGVGCAACGAVILSTVLSFFGVGGLLAYFPYHGIEVGYVGLTLLVFISYSLAKRLHNPYTC